MKKILQFVCGFARQYTLRKWIMRLSCYFLLLLASLQLLSANPTSGQNIEDENVTLKEYHGPLKPLFDQIEKQTNFLFLFRPSVIEEFPAVSIEAGTRSVKQVLDIVFAGSSIEYKQQHKNILIFSNEPEKNSSEKDESQAQPSVIPTQEAVTGKVTSVDGEPMAGVNIIVKGTTNGTTTDVDGKYSLAVLDADAILVFSFIGYTTQEIAVSGRTVIDIILQEDVHRLEEVVVVGYGTQKKTNLTGAVKQLGGEEIASQSSIQTSAALMGKIAGVQVIQNSGQPGQNQGTIRIRGSGTLGNSNPLILIDGIPGELNNIPSTDIASITVLKDAAAAAVYGSRAANGVILVTTKRGTADKIQVRYSAFLGLAQATDHPEFVDGATFMKLQNLGAENLGMSQIWSNTYIQEWEANHASDPDNYPSTDWVKEAFSEAGLQQRHTIGVSGGSETIRLLGSLSYDEENSNIPNYGFKRYSIRLNTDIYATDKLDFNFDINLIRNEQTNPSQGIDRILTDIYRIPSVYVSKYSQGGWGPAFNLNNPLAYIHDGGLSRNQTSIARTRLGVNYQFFDALSVNLVYSPDVQISSEKSAVKNYQITDPAGEVIQEMPGINSLFQNSSTTFNHNLNAVIKFEKTFLHHAVSALGGYEFITFNNAYFNAFRDQFQLQDLEQLNAGSVANQQNNGSESEWALRSFFSRINYAYKSKYLLEGNLRYDGSSRFNEENRWGVFPSFSAGWVVSEEPFMDALRIVNSFKIRGSWGILGNQQIGTYPFVSTIDLGQKYIFGGTAVGGAAQLGLANSNISWEKTASMNLGIDVALLEDRFNFSVDVFNRHTSDILLQLPIPLILGLTAPFQNAGEVQNRGWEMEIGYRNMIGKEFSYGVAFNLSDVKNKVTNLRGAGPFITGSSITMEGAPISSIFGYESDGFFNSQQDVEDHAEQPGLIGPGDLRYVDQNNDGIINADDRVIVGDPFPSLNYGINLTAKFRGFDFSVFFQGVGRRDVYLSGYAAWPLYNGSNIRKWQAEDFWSPENMDASMPRFTTGSTHSNFNVSDFWVSDASYLRLRNFQIGYRLSSISDRKLLVNSVRLFLMGENLFTLFNKMPQGVDPNVPNGSTYFPINKLVTVGMNVEF